jgi:hypothetical protein
LPDGSGSEKSGATVPSGNMVEYVFAMRVICYRFGKCPICSCMKL